EAGRRSTASREPRPSRTSATLPENPGRRPRGGYGRRTRSPAADDASAGSSLLTTLDRGQLAVGGSPQHVGLDGQTRRERASQLVNVAGGALGLAAVPGGPLPHPGGNSLGAGAADQGVELGWGEGEFVVGDVGGQVGDRDRGPL